MAPEIKLFCIHFVIIFKSKSEYISYKPQYVRMIFNICIVQIVQIVTVLHITLLKCFETYCIFICPMPIHLLHFGNAQE